MDLNRMLERCHREQWRIHDLSFTTPPRTMTETDERHVVQYFTDMAVIERLAGALFHEQRRRAEDPLLQEIFDTFEQDEIRHSQAAQMLADHFDRRKLKVYQPNPHMLRFQVHFVETIRHLTPEIANVYITTGEFILDIALLRSICDFVNDVTCDQVMALINRDESRHIAVDIHMVEYYSSQTYLNSTKQHVPRSLKEQSEAQLSLLRMMYHAAPFFREVFFEPMDRVDPTGRRMKEAFKRLQLLSTKPGVSSRPFVRFMLTLQKINDNPKIGRILRPALVRVAGVDSRVLTTLYSQVEREKAVRMSFDDHATEALDAKYTH